MGNWESVDDARELLPDQTRGVNHFGVREGRSTCEILKGPCMMSDWHGTNITPGLPNWTDLETGGQGHQETGEVAERRDGSAEKDEKTSSLCGILWTTRGLRDKRQGLDQLVEAMAHGEGSALRRLCRRARAGEAGLLPALHRSSQALTALWREVAQMSDCLGQDNTPGNLSTKRCSRAFFLLSLVVTHPETHPGLLDELTLLVPYLRASIKCEPGKKLQRQALLFFKKIVARRAEVSTFEFIDRKKLMSHLLNIAGGRKGENPALAQTVVELILQQSALLEKHISFKSKTDMAVALRRIYIHMRVFTDPKSDLMQFLVYSFLCLSRTRSGCRVLRFSLPPELREREAFEDCCDIPEPHALRRWLKELRQNLEENEGTKQLYQSLVRNQGTRQPHQSLVGNQGSQQLPQSLQENHEVEQPYQSLGEDYGTETLHQDLGKNSPQLEELRQNLEENPSFHEKFVQVLNKNSVTLSPNFPSPINTTWLC